MFDDALKIVLAHEGGVSSDPNDPGNWTGGAIGAGALKGTNRGISAASYPDLDIKSLSMEKIAGLYRYDYWRPVRADDLPDAIALFTFDAAVQHGTDKARRLLQEALGVTVDGIIGPRTIGAVDAANTRDLLVEFGARRMRYYGGLGQFDRYGLGWSRRMVDVFTRAVEWL